MQNQNIKPLECDSLNSTTYDPDGLIDGLIDKLCLKNDAALSRLLAVAPPVISKIRHRRLPVGPSLLLRIQDATGIQVNEARQMAGLPIPQFGARC